MLTNSDEWQKEYAFYILVANASRENKIKLTFLYEILFQDLGMCVLMRGIFSIIHNCQMAVTGTLSRTSGSSNCSGADFRLSRVVGCHQAGKSILLVGAAKGQRLKVNVAILVPKAMVLKMVSMSMMV